ncbi:MAG: Clp protease N-terminal domain-containing protein, partial [Acidimicrobiales bacterium]
MFERFNDRAREALFLAQGEARLLGHDFVGTEHLLLGLIAERDGVAGRSLALAGVELEPAREAVSRAIGRPSGSREDGLNAPYTARSKRVLELALRES